MKVLSLFDGISCGQLALNRAGIPVEKYYASEIDKYAIKVTQANFPDTIQVGDVKDINPNDFMDVNMIMGGSPCQGFSFAGKQLNFNDERSKLFFEYVRILKAIKPKYFLLENVMMKKEYMGAISEILGDIYPECVKQLGLFSSGRLEPIQINSALVSAQNRERLYWTNIPGVKHPGDKNILFKNLLENNIDKSFYLSQYARMYMDREVLDGRNHWDFAHHSSTENDKSSAVVSNFYKGIPYNVLIDFNSANCPWWDCDFQANDNSFCAECDGGDNFQGEGYPTKIVRHFTPIECERLQTLPDNYTRYIPKTQRYKSIGNGWTVDVISHIFSFIKGDNNV